VMYLHSKPCEKRCFFYYKTTEKEVSQAENHHWLKFSEPPELVAANLRFFFWTYSLSSSVVGAACLALELDEQQFRSDHLNEDDQLTRFDWGYIFQHPTEILESWVSPPTASRWQL
jgi:hypothetical protein